MTNIETYTPLQIVEYYFKNGSLRKTAKEFGIHYNTLWKWVRDYRRVQESEIEEEKLLTGYRRPWNRTPKELEEKIALLKEKEPGLTVRKAKEILEKQGIKISIKGIWSIWKRYGYTGFKKKNMTNTWIDNLEWTYESKIKFKAAKKLFEKGKIKECARLLNSIPALPKNDLILKIPDRYLNLKRKCEKIAGIFGKIPFEEYIKRVQKLHAILKRNAFNYSALRIGLLETVALCWKKDYKKVLRNLKELKRLIGKDKGSLFEIKFAILIAEGFAYSGLQKIRSARQIARICKNMLLRRKYVSPYFMDYLGALFSDLEEYRYAEELLLKSIDKVDEETRNKLKTCLFGIYLLKGDYKNAVSISRKIRIDEWAKKQGIFSLKATIHLINGNYEKAISYATKGLAFFRRENLYYGIFHSSLILAGAFFSVGENSKSKKILKSALNVIDKNKLPREFFIIKILLKEPINIQKELFPTVQLAVFLKEGKYYKALFYAREKYLISCFHRYILFFPELINDLIKKGKEIYLPKTMLKLPVFNKNIFVFDIRFLGRLKVYRSYGGETKKLKFKSKNSKELLKLNLTPKEKAFLIHLALRLPEPGRTISLKKIYKNFWKDSKKPERNLSHVLSKIRKQLKIPVHLLEISRRGSYPVLKNNGIYFLTDYLEFKETIARAKAFLRAEEYEFAKKEFKSALKLIRGKPFEKMYDKWSEDKRMEILFEIEILRKKVNLKKEQRLFSKFW